MLVWLKEDCFLLQWQAGSRQQATPAGFEPDKSNWGWNWLERWMAVRPWENRFLDINLKDGVMIRENGSADEKSATRPQVKSSSKKAVASNHQNEKIGPSRSSMNSNLSTEKTATSHSDGCSSSPNKSASKLDGPLAMSGKPRAKVLEDLIEGASSKSNIILRSHSNPKERSSANLDKPVKNRLSLPGGQLLLLSHSYSFSLFISIMQLVEILLIL